MRLGFGKKSRKFYVAIDSNPIQHTPSPPSLSVHTVCPWNVLTGLSEPSLHT